MSKRYSNFDHLRAWSILAVIIIHLTAPLAKEQAPLGIVLNQLARFAVPSFLVLSGWGLDITNAFDRSDHYLDYLWPRIKKVWPDYLIWSLVYALTHFILVGHSLTIKQSLVYLLNGGFSYHLYFVPLITGLYILYPAFVYLTNHSRLYTAFNLIFIFQHITDDYLGYIPFDMLQDYYTYAFCFAFGIWLSHDFEAKIHYLKRGKHWAYGALFTFTIFTVFESLESQGTVSATTRPFVTFYALCLILCFMVTDLKPNRFFSYLSKYSYFIYLSHVCMVEVIEAFIKLPSGWMGISLYLGVSLLLVLIFGLALIYLVKGIKGWVNTINERKSTLS